jgi:hypothetical protein
MDLFLALFSYQQLIVFDIFSTFNRDSNGRAVKAEISLSLTKGDFNPIWNWSGRRDLNSGPHGPEPCALAGLRYAPSAWDYNRAYQDSQVQ